MFALLASLFQLIPAFSSFMSLEQCLRHLAVRGINPVTEDLGDCTNTPFQLGEEVPFTYTALLIMEKGPGVEVVHGEWTIRDGVFRRTIFPGVEVEVSEDAVKILALEGDALIQGNRIKQIEYMEGDVEDQPQIASGQWFSIVRWRGARCWMVRGVEGSFEYGEGVLEETELQDAAWYKLLQPKISKWYPYPS